MNITKLNLGNFAAGKAEETNLPPAPKNFSYFGRKNDSEEPEFTKTDLSAKTVESQKKGFEEGYGKGKQEVMQTALALEQNTKAAVENIVANLSAFLAAYEEEKKNFMRSMTKVTIAAIQKIASKVIKENTEEVIMQALEKSASIIAKQPEIILKAKKEVLEKIQTKVDELLKAQDFKGKITYIPEENLPDGNCVMQWGESGVNINAPEVIKQIEESLSEYLKSI